MDTITLPQKEYQKLLEKAFRYDYLTELVKDRENIFTSPPTRSVKEAIKSFRATKLYSPDFLRSLAKGLKRSSYFRSR